VRSNVVSFGRVLTVSRDHTWQQTRAQLTLHSASVVNITTDVAKDHLTSLMIFLRREVKNEQYSNGKDILREQWFPIKDKNKRKSKDERDPEIATAFGVTISERSKAAIYVFCEPVVTVWVVKRIGSMHLEKRFQAIKDKQGCFNYLKVEYSYKRVLAVTKAKCPWCDRIVEYLLMCRNLSNKDESKQIKRSLMNQFFMRETVVSRMFLRVQKCSCLY